jgi:glycosyltransferase involved in cell wall biosynthesis
MTSSRPQVWILDGSAAVTGAFVSARDMARALHGNAEVVLVLPEHSRISETELTEFAAVHRLPIRSLRRTPKDAVLYLPFLLIASIRLRRLIRRDCPSMLLINDFYLMQGPLLRVLGFRGQMLTWVRMDPTAFGRIGQIWLATSAAMSNRMIAVSRHVQSLLPPSIASDLLYDPISAEFLPPPPPRSPDGYDFVFLGNYINGKGQDVAIAAMAELLKTVPTARLHFHGDDMGLPKNRRYLAGLKHQAERLGVTAAVTFGGFAKSSRAVLEGAFAALNLSRSESFSRTVLEASACGLPVIATRCGGPEEIVEDGRTGFLIPVGDAKACAEAMRMLCNDRARASRMGADARASVMLKFAPDNFADNLKALILSKN